LGARRAGHHEVNNGEDRGNRDYKRQHDHDDQLSGRFNQAGVFGGMRIAHVVPF
jgi:hypothetical protein